MTRTQIRFCAGNFVVLEDISKIAHGFNQVLTVGVRKGPGPGGGERIFDFGPFLPPLRDLEFRLTKSDLCPS